MAPIPRGLLWGARFIVRRRGLAGVAACVSDNRSLQMAGTGQGSFVKAKTGVVMAALAGGLCFVLLFCGVLRYTMRSPSALNPAGYEVSEGAVPEGFRYEAQVAAGEGALQIRGWACVVGERILSVDNWVVLYDGAAGRYLRLPTTMELDEAATAAVGDGIEYARAGFTSLTPLKALDAGGVYELCFAYRSNGHNLLVHTGQEVAL